MLAAWRTLKVTQQEQWALQSHRSRGRRFLCGESRGSCLSESLVTQTTFDLEALTFNIYHRVSSVWIWFLSQTLYHRLGWYQPPDDTGGVCQLSQTHVFQGWK